MEHIRQRLIWIGIASGIGGAVNAWLCYLGFPVSIMDTHFQWHLIPAGMLHGSILALSAVGASIILKKYGTVFRVAATLLVGWLGGYLSWIPLQLSVLHDRFIESLAWPFKNGDARVYGLWIPFLYFGMVAALLYLWLNRGERKEKLLVYFVTVALIGAAGSLWWWWTTGELWYISLLHGTIWGVFTAYGIWRAKL